MITNMIGSLRYRVTLQAPTRTDVGGGAATITWATFAQMFARIIPLAGREIVVADGIAARITHEVWIRYIEGVAAQMRFVDGRRILEIRAVLDVAGRKRWLKCFCEERLP